MPENTYNRAVLEYRFNRDKEELIKLLQFLERDIAFAIEALKNENLSDLNELGIFQGNAVSADIMAARIKLEYRILKEGETREN